MKVEQVEKIRSLLVPIGTKQLLLPSSVVAEIAPYTNPRSFNSGKSVDEDILGIVDWREQVVPVLSLQHIYRLPPTQLSQRQRLVILYGIEAVQLLPFYAFVAISVPRSIALTADNLTAPKTQKAANLYFEVEVKLADDTLEPALIPDLTNLENLVRKYPQLLASIAQV